MPPDVSTAVAEVFRSDWGRIVATLAKLLNEPEMSDTEPKGFGCLHCHTMKKK